MGATQLVVRRVKGHQRALAARRDTRVGRLGEALQVWTWSSSSSFVRWVVRHACPAGTIVGMMAAGSQRAALRWNNTASSLLALQGVRVVKYFAWEARFAADVREMRDRELDHIRAKVV